MKSASAATSRLGLPGIFNADEQGLGESTFSVALDALVEQFKIGVQASPPPIGPSKLVHCDAPTQRPTRRSPSLMRWRLRFAKSRVETEDPDATLCEWEKPEPAAHDANGRRWLAEYGAVEEINSHRYLRVFEPEPLYRSRGFGHERIKHCVYEWLRQNVGCPWSGIASAT